MRTLLITLGVSFVMAVACLEVFHNGGKYDRDEGAALIKNAR
ncbi:hypothetical protein [Mariprofundus sp. KV]|nr:hypothetical protein [Mariprofundus sp. KV]